MQKTEETMPNALRALRWLKIATGVVLFVAGFKLMVVMAVLLTTTEAERALDIRYESFAGALFLILAIFIWRQSALALMIAVAVLTGEGIWSVIEAVRQGSGGDGSSIPLGGFALRLLLIVLMLRGVAAIRALKRSPASGAGAEG